MQSKLANLLKSYSLLNEEIGVINGCLLGDGTLSSSGKNFRLRIEHSKIHKEYVWWKYLKLKRICINSPQEVKIHNSIRFGTIGHPDINLLRKKWYAGRKKLPKDLKLDSLSLAIWFMDDGCKHRDTVDFSVHNYSLKDLKRLQKLFKEKEIDTTINSDSKGNRLYIKKDSYSVFKELVKPYIVKCMAYKLP